jgi:glutamate carboxypeptidase
MTFDQMYILSVQNHIHDQESKKENYRNQRPVKIFFGHAFIIECDNISIFVKILEERLLNKLIDWLNINSHSHNPSGIQHFSEKVLDEFKEIKELFPHLNFEIQKIDLTNSNLVQILSIRKFIENPKSKVLLVAHLDTVYPIHHEFQTAQLIEDENFGEILHGPASADIKAGILLIVELIKKIEYSDLAQLVMWEVLINPDEEIGSIGSARFLEETALRNDYGLVFEPSLPDGSFAFIRKGTGNFKIKFQGKAAHVGRAFDEGSSAIVAAAKFIQQVHELNHKFDGTIINTGIINGGTTTNVVPEFCEIEINIRIDNKASEEIILREIIKIRDSISKEDTNIKIDCEGSFNRHPKIPDEKTIKLFQVLEEACKELGLPFKKKNTGGCCDGNNLSFAGLPNIDSIGVRGDHIHSDKEFMIVESFDERLKLAELLIRKLV